MDQKTLSLSLHYGLTLTHTLSLSLSFSFSVDLLVMTPTKTKEQVQHSVTKISASHLFFELTNSQWFPTLKSSKRIYEEHPQWHPLIAFIVSYTFTCYSRSTSIIYEHTTDYIMQSFNLHTHITHIQDVHYMAGQLVQYNHACPKRGLIHQDKVMQLMKQVLYLQSTTAGIYKEH